MHRAYIRSTNQDDNNSLNYQTVNTMHNFAKLPKAEGADTCYQPFRTKYDLCYYFYVCRNKSKTLGNSCGLVESHQSFVSIDHIILRHASW